VKVFGKCNFWPLPVHANDDEKIKSSFNIERYSNTDLEKKFGENLSKNKASTAKRKKVNLG